MHGEERMRTFVLESLVRSFLENDFGHMLPSTVSNPSHQL
jgi:hypothetical protein